MSITPRSSHPAPRDCGCSSRAPDQPRSSPATGKSDLSSQLSIRQQPSRILCKHLLCPGFITLMQWQDPPLSRLRHGPVSLPGAGPTALVAAQRGPAPISPPGWASPAQELFTKCTAARAGCTHKGSIDFPSKGYLQRSARGANTSCVCIEGRPQPDPHPFCCLTRYIMDCSMPWVGKQTWELKAIPVPLHPLAWAASPSPWRQLTAERLSPAQPPASGFQRANPQGLIPDERKCHSWGICHDTNCKDKCFVTRAPCGKGSESPTPLQQISQSCWGAASTRCWSQFGSQQALSCSADFWVIQNNLSKK